VFSDRSDRSDRSGWKDNRELIIYTESGNSPLLSNQYFKRKMTSLGYPEECLGLMELEEFNVLFKNYYIDKKKFAELTSSSFE
jgi:hypothetical protein